jgi:hypothetical protein
MIALGWLVGCAPRLPSATIADLSLVGVGWEQADAVVRVAVDNPLWIEVPITAIRWTAEVDGGRVASGSGAAPALAADAITEVPIPLTVTWSDLGAAMTTSAEEVSYRFAAEIDVEGPGGIYTVPVEQVGTMPRLSRPSVDLLDVGLGHEGTVMTVDLAFALGLPAQTSVDAFAWSVAVDDTTLGSGTAGVNADRALVLPMRFDLASAAGAAIATLLGRTTAVHLDLGGELGTPLGPVPLRWRRDVPLAP